MAHFPPNVYIARHATPDWSRTDIDYHVVPGPPLIPQGEEEARRLGAYLRAADVKKIYASPLERAHRTALIAGEIAGAPVEVAYALHEVAPSDNREAVRKRVADFWLAATAESAELGAIALVTHGGCVFELLTHLQVTDDEIAYWKGQFDRSNPLPPAGAWRTTLQNDRWLPELVFSPVPYQPRLAAAVQV
jgi:broad specificity phosphatase PhoE